MQSNHMVVGWLLICLLGMLMTYNTFKDLFHPVNSPLHEWINGILIDFGVNVSAEYQRMWGVSEQ